MCKMADNRRMMMMCWDGLEVEDDEFFESKDRISSVVPINLASSGTDDDDDECDDPRASFASAAASPPDEFRCFMSASSDDYNLWMATPGPIKDRRQRLLEDMGLSQDFGEVPTKALTCPEPTKKQPPSRTNTLARRKSIVRSKSESSIVAGYVEAKSREEMYMNAASKESLLRLFSLPTSKPGKNLQLRTRSMRPPRTRARIRSRDGTNGRTLAVENGLGGMFLIRNLDTGKVFLMNEDGTTSNLSDLQTGKQITMEEFEKSVEHSPIVKELMRRESVGRVPAADVLGESERKMMNATLTKSFKSNKKKGAGWLRNIKDVANSINGLIADSYKEHTPPSPQKSNTSTSKWTKVHQHGKSCKEITGLYMCQEIQAHEGSIWSIKFSPDAQYLASAGEDRVIHIWEVVDCDVSYTGSPLEEAKSTPCHPFSKSPSNSRPPLADSKIFGSERKKRGMLSYSSKKRGCIPDYVSVPETVFSLSDKPICSFEGHLDDVLDLSWSKSKQILSSSMDKTVRLWDLESKTCLKLFAHNDYVTCIQFNPIDDRYFISGSLDAKVRIWSIPDRKVVDWTDLHEMVTAVCYTPDGQGALVGSHKGSCRLYKISGCKLIPKGRFDVKVKKMIDVKGKKKCRAKKITGFQFAPGNPSEVLITSADSRIRIFDGSDITCKFRGFRNTSSQISASFSTDGRYVVSASEDSQVYVWKHEEIHQASGGKTKGLITTHSYERFPCKDVSVAIPWPGTLKYDPPTLTGRSKRHSKRINIHPPAPPRLSVPDALFRTSSITKIFPPLPKRNSITERAASCPEEELSRVSRTSSGIGESSNALVPPVSSNSFAYGDRRSMSATDNSVPSLSWLFDNGNSSGRNNVQAAAWGLVVVTAGLGGELRVYQNFGMPVRVGRQANLFASASVGSSTSKRFL